MTDQPQGENRAFKALCHAAECKGLHVGLTIGPRIPKQKRCRLGYVTLIFDGEVVKDEPIVDDDLEAAVERLAAKLYRQGSEA